MAKTAEEKAAAKAAKDAEKAAAKEVGTPPEGGNGQPPVEVAEAVAPAKPSKTAVTVKYRDHAGSEVTRTFSKEVHGEDFAKLAEEFKATNAARIIE